MGWAVTFRALAYPLEKESPPRETEGDLDDHLPVIQRITPIIVTRNEIVKWQKKEALASVKKNLKSIGRMPGMSYLRAARWMAKNGGLFIRALRGF